jgi:hypothetical protein
MGMNTQDELEQMEYLLTKESFDKWVWDMDDDIFNSMNSFSEDVFRYVYLKEHGLPLDSKIEGL